MGRDKKEEKNKQKRMLKCGVGLENKKGVKLGPEVREEKEEGRNKEG